MSLVPRILSYGIRNSRSEDEKARHTGSAKHGPFLLPAQPSDFTSPILVGMCFVSRCYSLHFSDSSGVSWGSAGDLREEGEKLPSHQQEWAESNPEHDSQEESTLVTQ